MWCTLEFYDVVYVGMSACIAKVSTARCTSVVVVVQHLLAHHVGPVRLLVPLLSLHGVTLAAVPYAADLHTNHHGNQHTDEDRQDKRIIPVHGFRQ